MKFVIFKSYGPNYIPKEFFEKHEIPYVTKYGDMALPVDGCVVKRTDERLIMFVEEKFKEYINSELSSKETVKALLESKRICYIQGGLEIVELPKGTKYRICDYDGSEYVETENEIEWLVAD